MCVGMVAAGPIEGFPALSPTFYSPKGGRTRSGSSSASSCALLLPLEAPTLSWLESVEYSGLFSV